MSGRALALADHARGLVGAPFARRGQSPEHGFDCIGLLRHCLIHIGCAIPELPGYSLRNTSIAAFEELASNAGLRPGTGELQAGDILVLQPGCAQYHIAIRTRDDHAIHAHAGLRRVIASPLPLPWPLIATWRLAESGEPKWQHSS